MATISQLLVFSGHPTNAAIVLGALLELEYAIISEISENANLDHSKTISGIHYWRDRDWLVSESATRTGRGRTPHVWSLKKSNVEIIQSLLSDIKRELNLRKSRLLQLERILNSICPDDLDLPH